MSQDKYMGMDVHQASVSVAVLDGGGKVIMECVLETKASTIVEFIRGVRGSVAVTSRKELVPPGCTQDFPFPRRRVRCSYYLKDIVMD